MPTISPWIVGPAAAAVVLIVAVQSAGGSKPNAACIASYDVRIQAAEKVRTDSRTALFGKDAAKHRGTPWDEKLRTDVERIRQERSLACK